MMEIQFRAYLDDPEEWVPDLAVVLDRYQNNGPATSVLTSRLIEMGLHPPGTGTRPADRGPARPQAAPAALAGVRPEGHHVLGLPRGLGDEGRDLDARVGRQGLGVGDLDPRLGCRRARPRARNRESSCPGQ